MFNFMFQSMLIVGQKDFPAPMLSVLNAAVPDIYGKMKSIFMTAKAREYLFDGIILNCTAQTVIARTVCVAVKQNAKALEVIKNNLYKFSFFGPVSILKMCCVHLIMYLSDG